MTSQDEDNEATAMAEVVPKDKYYATFILFYSMGMTTLIPSNFFTTATDYWMYKFRDPHFSNYSTENRTGLQAEFVSTYSIVANASNILFLIVAILVFRKLSMVKRVLGTLFGAILAFAFTCLFVQIDTDSWQQGFYITTLIIGFLLTGCGAIFMVTLFELIARFPAQYLAAILSGQAICGIFAALVQIFSLGIGASSTTNGLIYFSIGLFFIFLTLIWFLATLYKSEFFQYNINKKIDKVEGPKITKEKFFCVLNKLKYYLTSMIIVLGCSVMIHPGVTALVVSQNKGHSNRWSDTFFVPVITFLLYYVFDYVGRELASLIKKPRNGPIILILSICRIAFVPLLMFCNAQPRKHLPVVFDQDWTYIIFIIIFAISNGFLVNLCVIHVPRVTAQEEKQLSMALILVFMIVSLGTCSFISAALVKAI